MTILRKKAFEGIFFKWGLDGKRLVNCLREGPSFFEVVIINFTSQLLFELLFPCRLNDVVSVVIFHLRFKII